MTEPNFFDESTDQSQVKTAIVSKYFWAWAHVILRSAKKRGSRIAYIDLFAGPGRYKDGTKSTPLLILEEAIADPDLRRMLVTIFNDVDSTICNESGTRTSHHLIFVSKHARGYNIMKEIMAKQSSTADQGVPSFAYNPALKTQGLLFELSRPHVPGERRQNHSGPTGL